MILMRDFYKEVGDILGSGSTDYAIIPIGDRLHEAADGTTVTTVGSGAGNGLVLTYGGGIPSTWDVPTYFSRNQTRVPVLTGNASDQYLHGTDADFWSAISGGVDVAFSKVVVVIPFAIGTARELFSKHGNTSDKEHRIRQNTAGELLQILDDDSAGVSASVVGNALFQGVTTHIVLTYDGRGGVDAADGMNIYSNGINSVASRVNNASYVDMENVEARPALFCRLSGTGTGINSPINSALYGGPFGPAYTLQELTAVQVQNLYNIWVAGQRAQRSPQLAGIF